MMGAQLREMESALRAKGYRNWTLSTYSSNSFGDTYRNFEIQVGKYSNIRIREKFKSFTELYAYVMDMPERNPILYRKFNLEAA